MIGRPPLRGHQQTGRSIAEGGHRSGCVTKARKLAVAHRRNAGFGGGHECERQLVELQLRQFEAHVRLSCLLEPFEAERSWYRRDVR
jgi:hypothetical protein